MSNNPTEKDIRQKTSYYSEENFWKKVGKVAIIAGKEVISNALLLYYVATDNDTPITSKTLIWASLGYFICPLDLVPDVIPVLGYTDDVAALAMVLSQISEHITPAIREKANLKLKEWFD